MKKTALFSLVIASMLMSCGSDTDKPGYTFMDDMYSSPALRTFEPTANTPQGTAAMLPVEGTIPRGYVVYDLPNTNEAFELSKADAHVPANFADMDPAEGKELYTIFCSSCHGVKGDGEGILFQREKILGIPGYGEERLPEMTPGSIYHVMMHGKNNMGSHASQLTYSERWKIVSYVMQLRANQSPSA